MDEGVERGRGEQQRGGDQDLVLLQLSDACLLFQHGGLNIGDHATLFELRFRLPHLLQKRLQRGTLCLGRLGTNAQLLCTQLVRQLICDVRHGPTTFVEVRQNLRLLSTVPRDLEREYANVTKQIGNKAAACPHERGRKMPGNQDQRQAPHNFEAHAKEIEGDKGGRR